MMRMICGFQAKATSVAPRMCPGGNRQKNFPLELEVINKSDCISMT